MRIEELVAQVQQTLEQGTPLDPLEDSILAVLDATEANLEGFLEESQGDPEMPSETRERLRDAMEACLDSLEQMQDSLLQGSQALQDSLQDTLEKVYRVRQLQLEHQSSMAEGPTSFAFLNRLLLHAGRGDRSRTLDLLHDRQNFLQLLREELALRTLGPRDSLVLFELQAVLDREVKDLESFQVDLLAAAGRLAPLLARPAERRPTGLVATLGLERLARFLKEYHGKPEDGVQSALGRCRTALQGTVPPSSPPAALAALNQLLRLLDQLQADLLEAPEGLSDIRAHSAQVLALGQQLESSLALSPEARSYSSQSEGLPLVFRSVLEPAYALQEGRGDSNLVLAAAQHLQTLLDKLDDDHPEPSDDLEEALQVLSEAIEALQAAAGSGGPLQVELADALCREAAGKLKEAGIRLKEA
ncbi:hypothetical protein JST97_36915 [bacterium]|nr:hypothetical protein [bacterium]